eukprot:g23893.t1
MSSQEGFEPVIKIFGMEVQHLGLRVQWNAERPIVQRVVQGTAAEEGGVRPGDVLMAINGAETLVKEESAKKKFAAKAMFQSEEEEKVPRNVSKMTLNNSWEPKASHGLGCAG